MNRTWFDWVMLGLGCVLILMWVANRLDPGCAYYL